MGKIVYKVKKELKYAADLFIESYYSKVDKINTIVCDASKSEEDKSILIQKIQTEMKEIKHKLKELELMSLDSVNTEIF